MGAALVITAAASALIAAQLAALALFRETAVLAQVVAPVTITLAALVIGLAIGIEDMRRFDLAANAQFLQAIAACVGTALLTWLSLFFLKPTRSNVTVRRALTIALASMAAMLGTVRV